MFWIEFAVVLLMLMLGARIGGVFMGMAGGMGLAVLVFLFHLTPTSPPVDVMLIIAAVILAASALQAAGGMDFLVQMAEYILRKNPSRITFLAPMVSYLFTFMAGTGNVVFSILPVIAEVSREVGVRPERPITISAIASQQAITACPISAATVTLVALLAPFNVTLMHILMISVPSTIIGVLLGALYASRMGVDLDKDPKYLALVEKGLIPPVATKKDFKVTASKEAKVSVVVFLAGAILITLLGTFPSLRPVVSYGEKMQPLSMVHTIEILMLVVAGIIILACKADAEKASAGSVFRSGLSGVLCIFGIAWMGDTLIAAHLPYIKSGLQELVTAYPWTFSIALFAASTLILSQAATVRALVPLGITLGVPAPFIIAAYPAVNGYFFFPTYATLIAGVMFDTTGSTKIGKYVLNHSYMLPGLITETGSLVTGFVLAAILL